MSSHSFLVSYHHHLLCLLTLLPRSTPSSKPLGPLYNWAPVPSPLPPSHRIVRLLRLVPPRPRLSLLIPCPLLRLLLPSGRRAAPPLGPPPWFPLLAPLSRQCSTSSTYSDIAGSFTGTT